MTRGLRESNPVFAWKSRSDTTEWLHFHFSLSCLGERNGNPLQCSCLENPRDRGAWWAAAYGVAQSRARLNRLSSSKVQLGFPGGLAVKNPPVVQESEETCVRSLGWEDPLEEGMATTPVFVPGESHGQSSLAVCSPSGSQRVRHDWSALALTRHNGSVPSVISVFRAT